MTSTSANKKLSKGFSVLNATFGTLMGLYSFYIIYNMIQTVQIHINYFKYYDPNRLTLNIISMTSTFFFLVAVILISVSLFTKSKKLGKLGFVFVIVEAAISFGINFIYQTTLFTNFVERIDRYTDWEDFLMLYINGYSLDYPLLLMITAIVSFRVIKASENAYTTPSLLTTKLWKAPVALFIITHSALILSDFIRNIVYVQTYNTVSSYFDIYDLIFSVCMASLCYAAISHTYPCGFAKPDTLPQPEAVYPTATDESFSAPVAQPVAAAYAPAEFVAPAEAAQPESSAPTYQEPTTIQQSNASYVAKELMQYKELLDMGVITQDEFDAKKKQLLNL